MKEMVLVTGGAGFIGSYLVARLLAAGYRVRVLDNLSPQVHTNVGSSLDWLKSNNIEFINDSVLSVEALRKALEGVNVVVHLAAETGTGQSMYEISRYFEVNVQGTANLLDIIQNNRDASSVRSIVLASSRAIYGEGSYACSKHGIVYPESRSHESMSSGDFELNCPYCGIKLTFVETDENAPFRPLSTYGLTKQVQEQAVLMFAKTNKINGFAFRYQNVFGPGQSLKNPYTGILAVFSNLARQGEPIEVYEDGLESRDFVYIDDTVEATMRAIDYDDSYVGALNVGTGIAVPVLTVAQEINRYFGGKSEIKVSGAFRFGDIRHNKASTTRLESVLNFKPSTIFLDGLHKFLDWAENQQPEDKFAYRKSVLELQERGLMGQCKREV